MKRQRPRRGRVTLGAGQDPLQQGHARRVGEPPGVCPVGEHGRVAAAPAQLAHGAVDAPGVGLLARRRLLDQDHGPGQRRQRMGGDGRQGQDAAGLGAGSARALAGTPAQPGKGEQALGLGQRDQRREQLVILAVAPGGAPGRGARLHMPAPQRGQGRGNGHGRAGREGVEADIAHGRDRDQTGALAGQDEAPRGRHAAAELGRQDDLAVGEQPGQQRLVRLEEGGQPQPVQRAAARTRSARSAAAARDPAGCCGAGGRWPGAA